MPDKPPRELLNHGQREQLAQLIRSLRRDGPNPWDMPGIVAAVIELEQRASDARQVCATAVTAAAMPDYRTPAMMWRDGRHWPPQGDGDRRAPLRAQVGMPCPSHPQQRAGLCPLCPAEATPPPQGWRETIAARIAEGRATGREAQARLSGKLKP